MKTYNKPTQRTMHRGVAVSVTVLAVVAIAIGVSLVAKNYNQQAQPVGGIVITSTFRALNGTEYDDISIIVSSVYDDRTANWSKRIDGVGGVLGVTHRSKSPLGSAYIVQDGDGRTVSQVIDKCVIPETYDILREVTVIHGNTTPLERLLEYGVEPIMSNEDKTFLINSGAMVLIGEEYSQGHPVKIYSLNDINSLRARRALVALTENGIKTRLELWSGDGSGPADYLYVANRIRIGGVIGEAFMSDTDFDPIADDTAPIDHLECFDFTEEELPEIIPNNDNIITHDSGYINNRFSIGSSLVITGTQESWLIGSILDMTAEYELGTRHWWVVDVIEDVQSPADVLVVQGVNDDAYTPINLLEVWPPAWQMSGVADYIDWVNQYLVSGQFADSVAFAVYGVAGKPGARADWKEPYDYIVTWVEEDVRVVMMARGLTQQEAVELSTEYRSSGQ